MSFFRGGRAFVQSVLHQTRRAHRRTHVHVPTTSQQFTITFTAPSAMQSAPIGGSNALGSVVGTAIRSASTASGSKGCGSPSCCQGMTAITAGEDGEEPFIGAPSLSSPFNNNQSTQRGVSASCNDHKQSCNNNSNNNNHTATNVASASSPAAGSPSSSSPPPPRVKCDPYEQGGHPLSTDVVKMHMSATLDAGWSYDEPKKLLVRSFEFGRNFSTSGESTTKLFAFVTELGNIQTYGSHPLYNLNLNLRANSVQVMLRTVPLRGISFQDLMLATKVDGMWFRIIQAKGAAERQAKENAKQENAQQ